MTDAVGPPESAPGSTWHGSPHPPLQHQRTRVLSRPRGKGLGFSHFESLSQGLLRLFCLFENTLLNVLAGIETPSVHPQGGADAFQNPDSQTSGRKVHNYLVNSLFRLMKRAASDTLQ